MPILHSIHENFDPIRLRLSRRYHDEVIIDRAVLFSLAFLFSCAGDDRYGPMYGPGGGWPMMHYGYGGWFMWILLVIVIVIAFCLVVQTQKGRTTRETPLEILKKRYAKGEIKKEDYDPLKRELSE